MKAKNKFISVLVSTAIVVTSICPTFASAQMADVESISDVSQTVNVEENSSTNTNSETDTSQIAVLSGAPDSAMGAESDEEVDVEIPDRAKVVGEKTITIHLNGGTLDTSYLESANDFNYNTDSVVPDSSTIRTRTDGDTVYIYVKNKSSVVIPSPEKEGSLFIGYFEDGGNHFDSNLSEINLTNDIEEYVLSAEFGEPDAVQKEDTVLFEEFASFSLMSRAMTFFGLNPYARAATLSRQELLYGVDFSKASTGGNKYVFTAPYDGDYIFTAYGANGGLPYGDNRYISDQFSGFGGKAAGTVTMKKGQTATFFFGEAGLGGDGGVSDSSYYRNRTYGGGGRQILIREAWYKPEDLGIYDRYHVGGRGGGATYVSLDGYDIEQNSWQFAAYDYTSSEHAKNTSFAASAESHVLVMAGGGGGATSDQHKGANGGGYTGGKSAIGQYYIGTKIQGNYNFNGNYALVDSDRTDVLNGLVDQSTHRLTEAARINAEVFSASNSTAGFGLHYTILGEVVDWALPWDNQFANKMPEEGAKRTWGSFYYGANACTCSGGGGGGWFGGGSEYGIGGGGGASFAKNHSVKTSDGGTVAVKNVSTKAGANAPVKYGGENTTGESANRCHGHVTVTLVGETAKLSSVLQPSANNATARNHQYPNNAYGQQMVNNGVGNQYENGNSAEYEAYVYVKPTDYSASISNQWQVRTRGSSTWSDVPNNWQFVTSSYDYGIQTSGAYQGYRLYSVRLTINVTDGLMSMDSVKNSFYRLKTSSTVDSYNGPLTFTSITKEAPFAIKYVTSMMHMGVNKYSGKNVVNWNTVTSDSGISQATLNHNSSLWYYPDLDIRNGGTMKAFIVTIGGDSRNTVNYDFNGYSGVTLLKDEGGKKRTFYAKDGMSEASWEDYLRNHVSFTVYDNMYIDGNGTIGGATVTWTGYKSCGTAIPDGLTSYTFQDGTTHYYKGMLYSAADSYASSKEPGPGYYFSARNIYYAVDDTKKDSRKVNGVTGHVVTINNEEEWRFLSSQSFTSNKMVGLIPFKLLDPGHYKDTAYVWQTDLEKIAADNGRAADIYSGMEVINNNIWGYLGYIEMVRPRVSMSEDDVHLSYGELDEHTWYGGNMADLCKSYIGRVILPYYNLTLDEYYGLEGNSNCNGEHSLMMQRGFFLVGPHGPNNARGWTDDYYSYNHETGGFDLQNWDKYAGMQFRINHYFEGLVTAGFDRGSDSYDGPFYGVDMGYLLEYDSLPPSEPQEVQCYDSDVIGTQYKPIPVGVEPGSVKGKVWVETDGDGIYQASKDAYFPNFTLTVYRSSDNAWISSVNTDSSGNYSFSLAPGEYYVQRSLPSMAVNSKSYGINSSDSVVNVFSNGSSPSFTITEGQTQTGINCGVFIQSCIQGFVYNDESNSGRTGGPGISGVPITLKDGSGNPLTGVSYSTFKYSDQNGYYNFTDLPEGSYTVEYSAAGRETAKVAKLLPESTNYVTASNGIGEANNIWYNNAVGQYSMNENSVAGSESLKCATVQVNVASAGANNGKCFTDWGAAPVYYRNCGLVENADKCIITGTVWNDTNGNGIREESEKTLSGVKVTLADTSYNPIESPYDGFDVSTQTGSDGEYTLYCEKGKSYTVLVSDRQILNQQVENSISDFVATKYVGGTDNVAKDLPDAKDRNIVYASVNNVQGKVTANLGIIQKNTMDAKFVNTSTTAGTRYGTNVFKGGEYGELVITVTGELRDTSVDYDSVLKAIQAAAVNAGVFIDGNFVPKSISYTEMTNKTESGAPGGAQAYKYECRIPINIPVQAITVDTFTNGVANHTGTVISSFANGQVITKNPTLQILNETVTPTDLFHTILD